MLLTFPDGVIHHSYHTWYLLIAHHRRRFPYYTQHGPHLSSTQWCQVYHSIHETDGVPPLRSCSSASLLRIPSAGPSLCLDALFVALNQAYDGELGYVPTRNLQLASVQLCVACRSSATLRVRVDDATPHTLLTTSNSPQASLRSPNGLETGSPTGSREAAGCGATRVPPVRAHTVVWERSAPTSAQTAEMELLRGARSLQLGRAFSGGLESVAWPEGLVRLELGGRFDWPAKPAKPVSWPSSIRHLTFGQYFDKPVDGVSWPESLETLTFGKWFNQPISGVEWPVSLERLSLGQWYNQPISGLAWPPSLRCLTFEGDFNHAITGAGWPDSLESLKLGHSFDQPVEGVSWPASLRALTFGRRFNRPVSRAAWPASLRRLTFGYCFDQPIDQASWPSSLRRLEFGHRFNHPVAAVLWPASLEFLAFGDNFNQPIAAVVDWPVLLRHLVFGYHFNQPVRSVAWPPGLRYLSFGKKFDRSGLAGVEWPSSLQILGRAFEEEKYPPTSLPRQPPSGDPEGRRRTVSALRLSCAAGAPPLSSLPPAPLPPLPASLPLSLPSRRAKRKIAGTRLLKSLRRKRLLLRRVFKPRFTRLAVDRCANGDQ